MKQGERGVECVKFPLLHSCNLGKAGIGNLFGSLQVSVRDFVPRNIVLPIHMSGVLQELLESGPSGVSGRILRHGHMNAKESALGQKCGGKRLSGGFKPSSGSAMMQMGIDQKSGKNISVEEIGHLFFGFTHFPFRPSKHHRR